MIAKPAATKGRSQRTRKSIRLPRPDPPLPTPRPAIRGRRSLRSRRPRQLPEDDDYDFIHQEEEEDEEEERVQKKLRLVVKLSRSPTGRESARVGRGRRAVVPAVPSTSSSSSSASPASSSSSSYADDEDPDDDRDEDVETVKPPKKRRIDRCVASSAAATSRSGHHEEAKENAVGRSLDICTGNSPVLHRGTLMPDKKELESFLDKLQKKGTYGAFAESVDPEEIPDYHDVIEHPTDFGSVRKKLAKGAYCSFRQFEEGKENAVGRSPDNSTGNFPALHCGTMMPDKKEMESILDKLQKKDTYGAFAEPVDPEELPDYHDVIELPMDFGTVRKKLAKGAYCSFEQFEDDVFLICSNAMRYNAPDTIYFRQARAIQDMARRKFQEIRDNMRCIETEQSSEEQARLNAIEKKTPPTECKHVLEPLVSDISSGATPAFAAETCTGPSTVNGIENSGTLSGVLDGNSSLGESKQEKVDDFSAKLSPSKIVRKIALVDENRRTTYNITPDEQPSVASDFVLNVFEDEQKQLVCFGPDAEHSYARSLARFAASLGPIAWEIASKSIEKALPTGMKFGPGWVGEYEPLPTTFLGHQNQSKMLTKSQISCSRTDMNEKVREMKSKDDQNRSSSNMQSALKNQVNTAVPIKASRPGNGTIYVDPRGSKPVTFGVSSSAQSRVNNTGPQKQNLDSNSTNFDFMNQMSNGISCRASIHVKEESPSEEPTDRRQAIFLANDRTPPTNTNMGSPQQRNQSTVGFTKASNVSQPTQISIPYAKERKSPFPENFLRDSNHVQIEMQKQFEANSFQSRNNTLGMAIEETNNVTRLKNPSSFTSSNQTGVKYGLGRGNNHDQTPNDPFKHMCSSGQMSNRTHSSNASISNLNHGGKMSDQKNCSSIGLNQSVPSIMPLTRDNHSPATSAAAKAWMSVGTFASWKSADGKNSSDSLIWNTPTSTSCINGDSMIRPGNLPIQVFSEASQDKSKGLVIFPQLISTDLLKFQTNPLRQGSSPRPQTKQRDNLPPDLNIGYQPPGSPVQPSPGVMDSQQPDLALQL